MSHAARSIVPIILALLAPAAASAEQRAGAAQRADTERSPTYGDLLVDLAGRAAARAAESGTSDPAMEAISELAVRWLETSEDGARVWEERPRSAQSAEMAVRNAERSLWRKERRHERIAAAAAAALPRHAAAQPGQTAALELAELWSLVKPGDRELVVGSALGLSSRELKWLRAFLATLDAPPATPDKWLEPPETAVKASR